MHAISEPKRVVQWAVSHYKFNPRRRRNKFSGANILVAGLFGTRTGLGRAAELVALTLEDKGYQVTRWDVATALGEPVTRAYANPSVLPNCSDVVCVFNPPLTANLAFSAEWLLARCVIGHWIYELETVPPSWARCSRFYDEIWVPTEYVKEAVETKLKKTVRVLPYGVELDPFQPASRKPSSNFVVGYSFAVNSNYYRKNPEDSVHAFKAAFPNDEDVRLYLRSNDINSRPRERKMLEAVIGNDARVLIFDDDNRIELRDFYNEIDVYLSPSKAEGYGLNLIEAAQAGIPVICNAWRLPEEIASLSQVITTPFRLEAVHDPQGSYSELRDVQWATPDLAEMATLLKSARKKKMQRLE